MSKNAMRELEFDDSKNAMRELEFDDFPYQTMEDRKCSILPFSFLFSGEDHSL